jgi:hypothetical protein
MNQLSGCLLRPIRPRVVGKFHALQPNASGLQGHGNEGPVPVGPLLNLMLAFNKALLWQTLTQASRKLEFRLFQVSISGAWIPDGQLYKGSRIRLVSLRVCKGAQQTRMFSSYTAERKFLTSNLLMA